MLLPAGYKCDHCILQLSWKVGDETYYSCSDVSLPNGGIYFDADTYLQDSQCNLLSNFLLVARSFASLVKLLSAIGIILIAYRIYRDDITGVKKEVEDNSVVRREELERSTSEFRERPVVNKTEDAAEKVREEPAVEARKEYVEDDKEEPVERKDLGEIVIERKEERSETHEVHKEPEEEVKVITKEDIKQEEDIPVVKEKPKEDIKTSHIASTPVKERPKKEEQPSPEVKSIEKPAIIISEPKSPDNTREQKPSEKPSRAKSAVTKTKRDDFITDMEIRRPIGLKPIGESEEKIREIKKKEEEEKERNLESSASKVWSQESPMGSINFSLMDSDIISPGTGSLASGSMSNPPELAYQEELAAPTGTPFLSALAERDLLDSIKKIIISKQTENVNEFRQVKETGKIAWTKTHFIFMLDCSGSMAGARWDSVVVGLFTCLKRIKRMVDVCVSAFTFDTKPNPFCRERTPQQAIVNAERMPFTGKGTNYMRAVEYAISLINKSKKDNYLLCLLFLSDGLGGYPADQVEKLKTMRKKGKKILFYTIACVTDEEKDMMKMATELQGEHYKVTNEEASKLVFSTILNV